MNNEEEKNLNSNVENFSKETLKVAKTRRTNTRRKTTKKIENTNTTTENSVSNKEKETTNNVEKVVKNVKFKNKKTKGNKIEDKKVEEKSADVLKVNEKRAKKTRKNQKNNNTNIMNDQKSENHDAKYSVANEKIKFVDHTGADFKKDVLKIIPLGGLLEIGKNLTVFEYGNEIVIVDCGLAFPDDDMLGVDLVIPDMTYLEKNASKIKGLVITHGHEDHIGAIPYLLKKVNVPIYATKLTAGLIENKLEEHKLLRSTSLNIVSQGETVKFGKMSVEFIRSSHSIPDAVAFAIKTPVGTIVHTGDFKIDYTPIDGKLMDLGRLAELGNEGVLALMSDSTNSERKGFTMSESSVGQVFDRLFLNAKQQRIIVATFASNVHRIQQIVNSAVKYGRKVAICGRSMVNMITKAKELGYIDLPDNVFIDIDMIGSYTDDKLVIITTGSQGEPMSALTRMASGDHKKVSITPNDLIIISATPIPGNEKLVSKVIDELMKIGAEVIYSSLESIHVSGHACQEEQKLMLSLVRPKYFIPVHGEYRHLMAHKHTAMQVGIPESNIFILNNGRILEFNKTSARMAGSVQSGKILVDGLGVGDVGNIVLRDRQHLSQDGLIVVVMTMDSSTGEIVAGPDVISRGFVYVRESENLMDEVKKVVKVELMKCQENGIKDWSTIKSTVKGELKDYIYVKTKRNPMILPIIMEV